MPLICSPFLFFSLNIDSPFFFLLDVTKSSWSFFCLFQTFWFWWIFFYWWTVCQTKVQTINVRWPLFKVIWKKKICSFKSQRGNKGSHFVFYHKETWPHIISKTWLFSLSRNFNSRKKKWFMLKFVPCFYPFFYSFILPKPPFQVFSLADIFFFLFSC